MRWGTPFERRTIVVKRDRRVIDTESGTVRVNERERERKRERETDREGGK